MYSISQAIFKKEPKCTNAENHQTRRKKEEERKYKTARV